MMSYTMLWTSLCSMAGKLIRRMSPCTRIIGGRPYERCKSEALFLTTKASSSEISIIISPLLGTVHRSAEMHCPKSKDYGNNRRQLASRKGPDQGCGKGRRPG